MRRWLLFSMFALLVWLFSKPIAWARHVAYGRYVARHKWYVFVEAIKLGLSPWQAIMHDWSKLRRDEWTTYARAFYAPDGSKQYHEHEFIETWNHHQKRNPHHWQYWMLTWDRGETECLPMPDKYRREMLADWHGAGKAITGKAGGTAEWYTKNRDNIKLHPDTRAWIELQLGIRTGEEKS